VCSCVCAFVRASSRAPMYTRLRVRVYALEELEESGNSGAIVKSGQAKVCIIYI
jgi:hypothetical protein